RSVSSSPFGELRKSLVRFQRSHYPWIHDIEGRRDAFSPRESSPAALFALALCRVECRARFEIGRHSSARSCSVNACLACCVLCYGVWVQNPRIGSLEEVRRAVLSLLVNVPCPVGVVSAAVVLSASRCLLAERPILRVTVTT